MSTIFAPNLIPSLQRNPRVALAAQVRRDGPLCRARRARSTAGNALAAKSVLRAEGGDLVCFAGHGGFFPSGLFTGVGGFGGWVR